VVLDLDPPAHAVVRAVVLGAGASRGGENAEAQGQGQDQCGAGPGDHQLLIGFDER
jgi:hypothetical protein